MQLVRIPDNLNTLRCTQRSFNIDVLHALGCNGDQVHESLSHVTISTWSTTGSGNDVTRDDVVVVRPATEEIPSAVFTDIRWDSYANTAAILSR